MDNKKNTIINLYATFNECRSCAHKKLKTDCNLKIIDILAFNYVPQDRHVPRHRPTYSLKESD